MRDGREAPRIVAISTWTIAKVLVLILALAFVWMIRHVLMLFFVALILASIINPAAAWFERRRLGRVFGIALVYAVGLTVIGLILRTLVPLLITEARDLIAHADDIWADVLGWFGPFREFVASHGLSDDLGALAADAFRGFGGPAGSLVATVRGLFAGVVSVIVVLVVAFYLLLSEESIKRFFRKIAPEVHQPYLADLFSRIEKALGYWVRAQLVLSAVVGTAVYLVLTVLGVKYALVLAVLAGLGETVPYIGPFTAAVPAVMIALTKSPTTALLAIMAYYSIHLVENHVLIPKVMQKATGLHPVVCIFSLLVGITTAGLLGALLAIPVATVLSVLAPDAFRAYRSR